MIATCCIVFGTLGLISHSAGPVQAQEDEAIVKPAKLTEQEQEEAKKAAEAQEAANAEEEMMIEATVSEATEIGPREVRLSLWDGSVLTGDIGVSEIHVKTKFGMLEVPIVNIVTFTPGLASLPELRSEIDELVADLGDREFQKREKAKSKLLDKGPGFLSYLGGLPIEGNAEQKKNMQLVLEALAEQAEDTLGSDSISLSLEDAITTSTFTIVGEVQEQQFDLATKYGMLRVELKDIRTGDRTWMLANEAIQRKIDIDAVAFFQRTPKATRIRVNAGDKISIRAEGTVQWASWGDTNSTPDGLPNQGMYNGIPSGALIARIGKSGDFIKIGSKNEFIAKTSGELILGIAMQDNFSNQGGYQWNGKYTATVRVESGKK
jgi:hypothetical protein